MGRTACTEPQCLYKGALYLFFFVPTTKCMESGVYIQHIDRSIVLCQNQTYKQLNKTPLKLTELRTVLYPLPITI